MEKYLAEYLRLSIEDGDIVDDKQESDSISHQRELIRNYKEENELWNMKSLEFVDVADIIGLNQKTFCFEGFTD